ncbi:MAG: glycosyltransferase family 39 protein, partial [Chloroflexi bacterium]|nr:glycosyltransferase family 39 protein [Chloroflexota bacterium]
MNTLARFTSRINFFLLAILALGAVLRLWGIDFGLPYTLAPDEPTHFTIALRIFKTGNLNPGWLNYPSLMFYLNALALVPYFLIQHARGIWQTPADIPNPEIVTMGVGQLAAPSEFLLSRGLTALFGVASIFLIYKIGCEFGKGKSVGLIAALMLAVSPASVYNSHLIRPDTMAVFFALVSFFFAQKILDDPRPRNYVWAGIGAGLATACKYNMPLIGAAILAAHFLKFGRAGWRRKEIYFAIGAGALTLFAASPYILLDLPRFVHDFGFEIYAQGAGHAGFEGNTIPWYLNFLITTEGLIAIAALIQAARIVRA